MRRSVCWSVAPCGVGVLLWRGVEPADRWGGAVCAC